MPEYLRFQTSLRCQRNGYALGLFQAAGRLQDDSEIEPQLEVMLKEALAWFNQQLPVPRRFVINDESVFWYQTASNEFIQRMWDLAGVLILHAVQVKMIRTTDPGMITYRDDYQIAAIPNRNIRRALRV